jgi:AcrR family transcriptional regulator
VTQADAAPATVPARGGQPGRGQGNGRPGNGGQGNGGQAGTPTREKILDVALDLFTDQGFDGTSMREIAERLGITKPSIYYHFASKEEILLALHMRQYEFARAALTRLAGQRVTLEVWGSALGDLVDQMAAPGQRKLFLMHERNQAALEKLHRKGHDDEHDDIRQQFQQALADRSLSPRDRVRMACSLGAALEGLFIAEDASGGMPGAELAALVKDAVRDLLTGGGG